MSIYTYFVSDMMGGCCVKTVKNAVKNTPFKDCAHEVDVLSKTLTLYLKDDDEAFKNLKADEVDELIVSALRDLGFDNTIPKGVVKKSKHFSHASWGALGLSSGFLLLLLPLLLTTMPFALVATLSLLSTALTIGLGWSFYRRAYHGIWQGAWTMDTLFSISTAVILGVSLSALLFPALPMMFEAGLLIFGFRHAGIAIADAFKAKLLGVRRFQDDAPQKVTRENGEVAALDTIYPGDKLLLSAGEMLPVDGVFELGSGMISSLYQTGSNQSKPLVIGQIYPAGTKLVSFSEPLRFCVKKAANDSFLAREDRAILKSKLNRALEKVPPKVNSFAYRLQFFVPMVIGIAAVSGISVGMYFASWMLAIQCSVCVLVAACPCTLGLIAPLVTHVGIKKIEKTGITFREPEHLETAAMIDCVMIDLNGTLTSGMPKVMHPKENKDLLALMAHLEKSEDHWVARAIKKAAKGLPFGGGECKRSDSTHNGHRVSFKGNEYVLGNRLMMENLGIKQGLDISLGLGESVVYLAKNDQLEGHLILEDKIREGAYQVVRELQASGKKVYLCTGSDQETANRYATAFNIPVNQVFSDCTIEGDNSKQAHLEALKSQGYHMMMIGDAGNDARVIAKSHFGLVVAHEGGHVGTQQGASAVLQTESLLPVLQLFKIARKTASNISQNVWFSVAYNFLAMSGPSVLLFGLGMVLNPAVGAALMILQTLLVFANVYRFDTEKEPLVEGKQPAANRGLNREAFDEHQTPLKPTLKSEPTKLSAEYDAYFEPGSYLFDAKTDVPASCTMF
jgi:P-type Cu2+ transporter